MDRELRRLKRHYLKGQLPADAYIAALERCIAGEPLDRLEAELGLEIQHILVVSTAHISQEESEQLNAILESTISYSIYGMNYGWLIYVPRLDMWSELEVYTTFVDMSNILTLLRFAAEQHCEWLRLDSDGPELKGFPIFDW